MEDGTEQNQQTNNTPPEGGTPAWYEAEGIDKSLITEKVKGFGDVNGLLKSYNESQSYIGGAVKIPTDKSTDDERAAFYAKLGRPETADKYDFKLPDGVSVEGATADNFKAFQKLCYDSGLSNKQYSAVLGGWANIVKDLSTKRDAMLAECATKCQQTLSAPNEWGDKYNDNLAAVNRTIDKMGIREVVDMTGLKYNVGFLKAINSVISGAKESQIIGADGKPVDKTARIASLKQNPAYLNSSDPNHNSVMKELKQLLDG